jgi:hypothetical protein
MRSNTSTMQTSVPPPVDYDGHVRAVLSEMDRAERETAVWLVSLFAVAGYMTHDAARRWRRQSAALRA